jgi:Lectin C-type domain
LGLREIGFVFAPGVPVTFPPPVSTRVRGSQRETMSTMKTIFAFVLLSAVTAFSQLEPAEPPPRPRPGIPVDALFFNNHWYRVYPEKLTWENARKRCEALGGQLAVIRDEPTWKFLTASLAGTPRLWLGASDQLTEGNWEWVDGSKMSYSNWGGKLPDNIGSKEHFLALWGTTWNDAANDDPEVVGFICEWRQ